MVAHARLDRGQELAKTAKLCGVTDHRRWRHGCARARQAAKAGSSRRMRPHGSRALVRPRARRASGAERPAPGLQDNTPSPRPEGRDDAVAQDDNADRAAGWRDAQTPSARRQAGRRRRAGTPRRAAPGKPTPEARTAHNNVNAHGRQARPTPTASPPRTCQATGWRRARGGAASDAQNGSAQRKRTNNR